MPIDGGTLKFLLEMAGARVEAGPSATDEDGFVTYTAYVTPAGHGIGSRRLLKIREGSDGDYYPLNCQGSINEQDAVALTLFVNGES